MTFLCEHKYLPREISHVIEGFDTIGHGSFGKGRNDYQNGHPFGLLLSVREDQSTILQKWDGTAYPHGFSDLFNDTDAFGSSLSKPLASAYGIEGGNEGQGRDMESRSDDREGVSGGVPNGLIIIRLSSRDYVGETGGFG